MRKSLICFLLVALLAACLLLPAAATDIPIDTPSIAANIRLTRTKLSGNQYTVSVELTDIPQDNPVEYAQILLTCRSNQHDIVSSSLSMVASSNEMLVTHQFNTTADSLLVLIEPKYSSFPGIQNGTVYTFTVKQKSGDAVDPGFDMTAVLILKDGTEQELNARVNASVSASCDDGHQYSNGFCHVCGAADPDYAPPSSSTTQPTTTPDPGSSTTQPPTAPDPGNSTSSGSTVPTTQSGGSNGNQNQSTGNPWPLTIVIILAILGTAGFCVYLALTGKKKKS